MKHLIAACLLLAACAPAAAREAASAPALAAVTADPRRHPTHPARNRQLVIPSGPVRPELGRPAEMNALFFLAAGPGPNRPCSSSTAFPATSATSILPRPSDAPAGTSSPSPIAAPGAPKALSRSSTQSPMPGRRSCS